MQGISNAQFIAHYPHNTSFPWSLQKIDTLNAALLRIGSLDNFALSDNKKIFFKNFLEDSFNEIKKWKVENLILDLRNNGGGELKNSILLYSYLANGSFQFSKEIEISSITPPTYVQYTNYDKAIKFNPIKFKSVVKKEETVFYLNEHFSMIKTQPASSCFKGNLFVMIRNTASSAGCLAAYIHSNKRGTIIGEENRDNYTGYSSGVPVVLTLPHSKIRINIPLRKFTYVTGKDTGRGTIPDLPVSMSCEDFFNGHDTDIEHTLKFLDSRQ
jgi:C-terminal processing protease CtpA/Prc